MKTSLARKRQHTRQEESMEVENGAGIGNTCIHTCIHAYMHTYTHTLSLTQTHTRTDTPGPHHEAGGLRQDHHAPPMLDVPDAWGAQTKSEALRGRVTTPASACMYVYIHRFIFVYECTQIYTHVCTYTYEGARATTPASAYIHTYACMYTHVEVSRRLPRSLEGLPRSPV